MAEKSEKQAGLLERLRTLPLDAGADVLLALHRGRLLQDDILTRVLGPGAPALVDQGYTGAGDAIYELARLQMQQLEVLLKYSRAQSNGLFESWRKRVRNAPAQLHLKGFIGGCALGTLTVENTSAGAAPLRLQMAPPPGAERPIPPKHCRFEPDPADKPRIDGGSLLELSMAVVLHPLDFKPGAYAGELAVLVGAQVTRVRVDLDVENAPR